MYCFIINALLFSFLHSFLSGEQSFISNTSTSSVNNYTSRKNTSVTNLKRNSDAKSNKSFSKPASRSSSNDPQQTQRSRNLSGQRSGSASPNNFKKLFIASQMMGEPFILLIDHETLVPMLKKRFII